MLPKLRIDLKSSLREGYIMKAGTAVVLLELVDPDPTKLVWLVEVALPRPDLIGGTEFEVLELSARDLTFPRA